MTRAVDLPPDPRSVGVARRFVADALRSLGLEDVVEEAELAVSELVANAVMHARTRFTVRVQQVDGSARVEVEDGSMLMPVPGVVATTAMSGRGLLLVATLAEGWGVEPLVGRGKVVWFTVSPTPLVAGPEFDQDALLALWSDLDDELPSVQVPDEPLLPVELRGVPVQALLAAKTHIEDVLRDLRLVQLNEQTPVTERPADADEVRLARRLDAAAEAFSSGRLQLRGEAVRNVARGVTTADIQLRLPQSAADAARRYRDVLDAADELCRGGHLMVAVGLREHADLRRWYLGEIIGQLSGRPAGTPPQVRALSGSTSVEREPRS